MWTVIGVHAGQAGGWVACGRRAAEPQPSAPAGHPVLLTDAGLFLTETRLLTRQLQHGGLRSNAANATSYGRFVICHYTDNVPACYHLRLLLGRLLGLLGLLAQLLLRLGLLLPALR